MNPLLPAEISHATQASASVLPSHAEPGASHASSQADESLRVSVSHSPGDAWRERAPFPRSSYRRPLQVIHLLRKCDPAEWGGTETAIQRLFEGLRQHDVASIVYCPRIDRRFVHDPLAASGCRVKRFRAFLPILGLPRQQQRQLVAVGGNLMSLELPWELWRERNVSVIHTHTLGRLGGIAAAVARKRGVPVVVTIHGGLLDLPESVQTDLHRPNRRGWEWGRVFGLLLRSRQLLEQAHAILTCNPCEATLLRERYPSRRILVHPHGVSIDQYRDDRRPAARAAFPQIDGREMLLSLGRIDSVKNQRWLVEEAPAVFQRHPRALLVLAGACTDSAYGETLQRRVRELGLKDRVLFTGGLPPCDPRLIGLLQEARVIVLPSVSETFGLVILEAWAAGSAVIASRTSGAMALVQHERNGWLFDLNDPPSFHHAVDGALRDRVCARHLAAEGHKLVRAEYDSVVLAEQMKHLYEHLIEENHAVRHSARR